MINTVVVHNGNFHADDVFAVAILQMIYPKVQIIRTRDEKIIKKADLRVDIGLKYDPLTNDFDHHQIDGAGFRENGIPYASVGLIWKHFWNKLVDNTEEFKYIDEKIIQCIDADDNGFKVYKSEIASPYTLSMLITSFTPDWQDKKQDFDKKFFTAVKFAKQILKIEIKKAKGYSKAGKMLKIALEKNKKNYLVLNKPCPWKSYLIDNNAKIDFVIYESTSNSNWHIQAVPFRKDSFDVKKEFPKEFAGLKDDELSKKTGISDSVFCHRNLFLMVFKSKESAIKMAEIMNTL